MKIIIELCSTHSFLDLRASWASNKLDENIKTMVVASAATFGERGADIAKEKRDNSLEKRMAATAGDKASFLSVSCGKTVFNCVNARC